MFLHYLSRQRPNIVFAHVCEGISSLAFLDILVTHSGNGFSSKLYGEIALTAGCLPYQGIQGDQVKIREIVCV